MYQRVFDFFKELVGNEKSFGCLLEHIPKIGHKQTLYILNQIALELQLTHNTDIYLLVPEKMKSTFENIPFNCTKIITTNRNEIQSFLTHIQSIRIYEDTVRRYNNEKVLQTECGNGDDNVFERSNSVDTGKIVNGKTIDMSNIGIRNLSTNLDNSQNSQNNNILILCYLLFHHGSQTHSDVCDALHWFEYYKIPYLGFSSKQQLYVEL